MGILRPLLNGEAPAAASLPISCSCNGGQPGQGAATSARSSISPTGLHLYSVHLAAGPGGTAGDMCGPLTGTSCRTLTGTRPGMVPCCTLYCTDQTVGRALTCAAGSTGVHLSGAPLLTSGNIPPYLEVGCRGHMCARRYVWRGSNRICSSAGRTATHQAAAEDLLDQLERILAR